MRAAERLDSIVALTIDHAPTGYAVSGPKRVTVDLEVLRTDNFWYAWTPGRKSRGCAAESGRALLRPMTEGVAGEIARSLPASGGGIV